ncbi:MAG: hypothetical protein OQJ97_05905, partial [Rhodospirillales bacterium]|nr:hypothetical protein [Rhodospirillales bacterium]
HFNANNSVEEINAGGGTVSGDASSQTLDFSDTTLTNVDSIDGGAGHDNITGSDGDDIIRGGTGNDNLAGGEGDDLFTWDIGDGNDRISGDDGWDTLSISDGNNNGTSEGGWTVTLDDGSEFTIDPADDGAYLDIANDTSGTVVDMDTGESISFEGIERIEF